MPPPWKHGSVIFMIVGAFPTELMDYGPYIWSPEDVMLVVSLLGYVGSLFSNMFTRYMMTNTEKNWFLSCTFDYILDPKI